MSPFEPPFVVGVVRDVKLIENFAECALGFGCLVGSASGLDQQIGKTLGIDVVDGWDIARQFVRCPPKLELHNGEFELVDWFLLHTCTCVRGCYPNARTNVLLFYGKCGANPQPVYKKKRRPRWRSTFGR